MNKQSTEYKQMRLKVMSQIQHPEAYYKNSIKSQGVKPSDLSHLQISRWIAELKRIEADLLIDAAMSDEVAEFTSDMEDQLIQRFTP